MRELKFRAWDEENKKLISWWDICNYYNLLSMLDPVARDYERFEVTQYTGLKDRTGTEIYEGDILEIYDRTGEKPISKAEVYWNDGYWDAKALKDNNFWSCYSAFAKNKVIGNIYENPELLEGENK